MLPNVSSDENQNRAVDAVVDQVVLKRELAYRFALGLLLALIENGGGRMVRLVAPDQRPEERHEFEPRPYQNHWL